MINRAHTTAAAIAEQTAIGAGKAKEGMIKVDAKRAADQVERALASAHGISQISRAAGHQ
jgi:hypothetical protein